MLSENISHGLLLRKVKTKHAVLLPADHRSYHSIVLVGSFNLANVAESLLVG